MILILWRNISHNKHRKLFNFKCFIINKNNITFINYLYYNYGSKRNNFCEKEIDIKHAFKRIKNSNYTRASSCLIYISILYFHSIVNIIIVNYIVFSCLSLTKYKMVVCIIYNRMVCFVITFDFEVAATVTRDWSFNKY